MEKEEIGGKLSGGRLGHADGRVKYPDPMNPAVGRAGLNTLAQATKASQENLHDVVCTRRAYHVEEVTRAYSLLTGALEAAQHDGFDFSAANISGGTSGRIPHIDEISFEVTYRPPC